MRIAHLSAEVSPLARTGGLGDVVGALPKAQAALGEEVVVWMPLYRKVWEALVQRGERPKWVCDPFRLDLGYRSHEVGLLETTLSGSSVPVFLVGSSPDFDRPGLYDRDGAGVDDGLARYALFVRAALEGMRRLALVPDVLHAHDWHATLAPMALAWDAPRDWHFERTVSILTIHNLAYQGVYGRDQFLTLNLPIEALDGLEWKGGINLMKGGILAADFVTAVSPTFAWEISTPQGGFGLDPIVSSRYDSLVGIVNGIDEHDWNPATDRKIPFNYDAEHLGAKRENRRALLRLAGMDAEDPGMVVGLVGRLTAQKGFDLLFPVLANLVGEGVRFVVLGSGDPDLKASLLVASQSLRGRAWGYVGWNDDLAHLIEAGADAFLMPSRFEPCGLSQLYSLAYGTPPIVRRVGGLVDTVIGFDGMNDEFATGFTFDAADPSALRGVVLWAQRAYHHPFLWTRIVRNGMRQDFRWERSAERYLEVYRIARARRGL